MFVNKIIRCMLDQLLPSHCELCGDASTTMLCRACDKQLPRTNNCCDVCSLPLEAGTDIEDEEPCICGECLKHKPDFDKLIAPFVYRDEVAWLINKFKHRNHINYGDYLSKHLQTELQHHLMNNEKPDLITAVPMHWTRLLYRGFNQAELLARKIAQGLNLPYKSILQKSKRSAKQQGLQRKARLKNLRHVFQLKDNIEGKFISIVDDVVTTGATAQTLASLLIDAGARRVEIWALARTPKPE